jgi:hypothetical protein
MKTRSLGIAFAALLACAPVRGFAEDAASPAAPANAPTPTASPGAPPPSVPRPSIVPNSTVEGAAPAATDGSLRKPRRQARKNSRRYAYWEPFPVYWPSYHRHQLSWRRVAWFSWF